MSDRFVELVALGPELCKQAERSGKSVNEAHFLVHEILTQTFGDLHRIPREGLRDLVVSALESKLGGRVPRRAACRRTGVLRARRIFERVPAVWRVIGNGAPYPREYAAAGTC